jgi:hypothetical protein
MITRELMQSGWVKGLQAGREWRFSYRPSEENPRPQHTRPDGGTSVTTDEPYPWDAPTTLECRFGMAWTGIGRIALRNGRLFFPAVPATAGLYRFRIRRSEGESAYIGESENLARRFMLYANPGPSQQTNLRLNGIFRQALSGNCEIGVAVVTNVAWIEFAETRKVADLSIKAVRRALENVAIIGEGGDPVNTLNR